MKVVKKVIPKELEKGQMKGPWLDCLWDILTVVKMATLMDTKSLVLLLESLLVERRNLVYLMGSLSVPL